MKAPHQQLRQRGVMAGYQDSSAGLVGLLKIFITVDDESRIKTGPVLCQCIENEMQRNFAWRQII